MRWAWRIGTVAGIPVYVHGTFIALIGFFFISDWMAGKDLAAAVGAVIFILAVFGSVVLHELGHAFTARHFGINTRDITLLPIGGLARLERMPQIPRQELWVALAGPAVNIALAGATYLTELTFYPGQPTLSVEAGSATVLGRFLAVNLWLALFNLLPAFPMDGGRALRAILAERLDYVRATEIAASLGQGLALLFGFLGLFTNPMLVFIALFVWMGASAEASTVTLRAAMAGIPVSRAMMTDFRTLQPSDTLQHAAELVLAGAQRDFPVLAHGQLVGVLSREALVGALARDGHASRVEDAMSSQFETVEARDMLEAAVQRLQEGAKTLLPVISDGRLVGLLTPDNVGEFVMLRTALSPPRS